MVRDESKDSNIHSSLVVTGPGVLSSRIQDPSTSLVNNERMHVLQSGNRK